MRRFILIALMAAMCAVVPASAERATGLPQVNGIPILINFGAKSISTDTVTLTPGVETDLSDYIPGGTVDFTMDVWDGDVLFGHEDNLATGTSKWHGYLVASGTKNFKWEAASAGTFKLWAIPNGAATCTLIITLSMGQWEE